MGNEGYDNIIRTEGAFSRAKPKNCECRRYREPKELFLWGQHC